MCHMNKKLIATALGATFALTGCGGHDVATPAETPPETVYSDRIDVPAFINARCTSDALKTNQTLEALNITDEAQQDLVAQAVSCVQAGGSTVVILDFFEEEPAQVFEENFNSISQLAARRSHHVVALADNGSTAYGVLSAVPYQTIIK